MSSRPGDVSSGQSQIMNQVMARKAQMEQERAMAMQARDMQASQPVGPYGDMPGENQELPPPANGPGGLGMPPQPPMQQGGIGDSMNGGQQGAMMQAQQALLARKQQMQGMAPGGMQPKLSDPGDKQARIMQAMQMLKGQQAGGGM